MVRVAGIYREPEFSPGKVAADAAIMDAALDRLAARGAAVMALTPAELARRKRPGFDLVLAMCQSEASLARLAALESGGAVVINSPRAIRSCYRDRLGAILQSAALPVPEGVLVDTTAPFDRRLFDRIDIASGAYVKRGGLHALSSDDVLRVEDESALIRALSAFAARGVALAYVQAAVEGRVVKFYGVTGTGYFSVAEGAGGARVPGLRDAAQSAAEALALEVWGGDAIVNGAQFKIIDFNDWPSFERVRAQAAEAIARRAWQLAAQQETPAGKGK